MHGPAHVDPDFRMLTEAARRDVERGIVGAVTPPGGLTPLQRRLLRAVGGTALGITFDPDHEAPATAAELAAALDPTPERTRHRVVQLMLMLELILHPLPPEVCQRVAAYARALGIEDGHLDVARDFAEGAYGLALTDLHRNGYFHDWDHHGDVEAKLHVHGRLVEPFQAFEDDEELFGTWAELRALPEGTLGWSVARFYDARGFAFPGHPESVSPTLAQHDFVHVLADYGSIIDGEIETFAFIAAADPRPQGFSWLAVVLGLFETGMIPRAAGGILEAEPSHLEQPGMCIRLADALRRGRLLDRDLVYGTDWFELAPLPLHEARARLGVVPKDPAAVAAGSVGVFERAGLSAWQLAHGDAALQPPA